MKLFVYGTLKTGFFNHDKYLGDARLLSSAAITKDASYYFVAPPPYYVPFLFSVDDVKEERRRRGVSAGGCETAVAAAVRGELYEVTEKQMEALDKLERCPEYYYRTQITVVDDRSREEHKAVHVYLKRDVALPWLSPPFECIQSYSLQLHSKYVPPSKRMANYATASSQYVQLSIQARLAELTCLDRMVVSIHHQAQSSLVFAIAPLILIFFQSLIYFKLQHMIKLMDAGVEGASVFSSSPLEMAEAVRAFVDTMDADGRRLHTFLTLADQFIYVPVYVYCLGVLFVRLVPRRSRRSILFLLATAAFDSIENLLILYILNVNVNSWVSFFFLLFNKAKWYTLFYTFVSLLMAAVTRKH